MRSGDYRDQSPQWQQLAARKISALETRVGVLEDTLRDLRKKLAAPQQRDIFASDPPCTRTTLAQIIDRALEPRGRH